MTLPSTTSVFRTPMALPPRRLRWPSPFPSPLSSVYRFWPAEARWPSCPCPRRAAVIGVATRSSPPSASSEWPAERLALCSSGPFSAWDPHSVRGVAAAVAWGVAGAALSTSIRSAVGGGGIGCGVPAGQSWPPIVELLRVCRVCLRLAFSARRSLLSFLRSAMAPKIAPTLCVVCVGSLSHLLNARDFLHERLLHLPDEVGCGLKVRPSSYRLPRSSG